jgi:phospholipase/carboxylesterase
LSVLVFLHGHDDDADRWRTAAEAMAPDGWVVERPTGPLAGPGGASWFGHDDDGLPVPGQVHAALDAVAGQVRAAADRRGVTPADVVLAGFSQGGAVALLHALRPADPPLAAVVAIAAWLPDVEGLVPGPGPLGTDRLLIAHGAEDDVVPLPMGRSVARLLQRFGHDVTFVEGPAAHDPGPLAPVVRHWLLAPR